MAKPAEEIDLAGLLRAAQGTPHALSLAIAEEVSRTNAGADVAVGITDREGLVYRVKAVAGGLAQLTAAVEISRDLQQEPPLPKEVGAFTIAPAPTTFGTLFGAEIANAQCLYTLIDCPPLATVDAAQMSPPALFIAVAVRPNHPPDTLDRLSRLAPFLGTLYASSLNELKLQARQSLVAQAGSSKDLGTLAYRAAQTACELFHVESVAVFLPDDSRRLLGLKNVFPRPPAIERLGTLRFRLDDVSNLASATYGDSKLRLVDRMELTGPLVEALGGNCRQVLLLPILGKDAAGKVTRIGVLACGGKSWLIEGTTYCGTFLWEDVALLEFFCDMLAILIKMLRAKDEAALRAEKTMHGAKTVLVNARDSLSLLELNGVSDRVPDKLQYQLPNTIALLDDLVAQIERKGLGRAVKIDRVDEVRFFGEAVAGMGQFAPALARALGRGSIKINTLKDTQLVNVPIFRSNRTALLSVLRNLIHNAVKYSDRSEGHVSWIFIDGGMTEAGERHLWMEISDNGIGLAEEDRELVFEEGYRGTNAVEADPNGLGVGLPDCLHILKALGGSLSVVDPKATPFGQASTTIRMELKLDE